MSGQYQPPHPDQNRRHRSQQPQQPQQPRPAPQSYSPIPPPPIGANCPPSQQRPQPGQSADAGSEYGNYPPPPRSTSANSNGSNRDRSSYNPERQMVRRNMTTDLIPSPAVPGPDERRRSSFNFTPLGPRASTPPSVTSRPPARHPVERRPFSALAAVTLDRGLDLNHTQRRNRAPGYEGMTDSEAARRAVRDLPEYVASKLGRGLDALFRGTSGGGGSGLGSARTRGDDRERRERRRDHSQGSTTFSTERRRR